MSGYRNPQSMRDVLPEVAPEDGRIGYVVTKHWLCWINYVVRAVLVTAGTVGLVIGSIELHDRFTAWWSTALGLSLVAFALWIAAHVIYLDARAILRSFILVTPTSILENRVEKWFYSPTTRVTAKNAAVRTLTPGFAGWFGVRTVEITSEGARPNITYPMASGGEAMEAAVNQILAKASSSSAPS